MEHIKRWPTELNFPNSESSGVLADFDFWREINDCAVCQREFRRRYRNEYAVVEHAEFWSELENYFEDMHPTIQRIATYLKAEIVVITNGNSESDWEKFDSKFLNTYCHFLICRSCSILYDNVATRISQENTKLAAILKYLVQ